MIKNNKAKKISSPLMQQILADANPLHKIQNNNRIALACRIDDLMKANGYSNSTFAQKLGKQPSVITKWLSGTHNFTMDTLDEIAYHLGVESAYLIQSQQRQTIYRKTIQVVTKIAEVDLKSNFIFPESNKFNLWNPIHIVGVPYNSLKAKSN
jgi:transcriptional regulator with XRE-family HTH domain